jgi:hypothetical protein
MSVCGIRSDLCTHLLTFSMTSSMCCSRLYRDSVSSIMASSTSWEGDHALIGDWLLMIGGWLLVVGGGACRGRDEVAVVVVVVVLIVSGGVW